MGTANNSNAYLYATDRIWSVDGTTRLSFQTDGNLVLRFADEAIWSSGTDDIASGGRFILQSSDGNLVVRDESDNSQWSSGTGDGNRENNGYHLVVITQCAFLIYEDISGKFHGLLNTEDDGCVGCNCSGTSYSFPTLSPTQSPSEHPTTVPTMQPTLEPTSNPTSSPSLIPTISPTEGPITFQPTTSPSINPTNNPTLYPTRLSTVNPSPIPSAIPTDLETTKTISDISDNENNALMFIGQEMNEIIYIGVDLYKG